MLRSWPHRLLAPTVLLATQPFRALGQTPPPVPSPSEVGALLDRLVTDPRIPGVAVGRIDGDRITAIARGRSRAGGPLDVTPATRFEIGSITKVFTGVLLAEMTLRGEVALDDPVARHLPSGTAVPTYQGQPITLAHLATHTSGLPVVPDNLDPVDPDDPYADYDLARLTTFLASHQLRRAPGAQFEYSNLGAGLLGLALATRAGTSYQALVAERLLRPLGMTATTFGPPPIGGTPEAEGHDGMGEPIGPWRLDVLAGAGALHSAIHDLLRLAAAALDTTRGPLASAMALSQRLAFRIDSLSSVGLGWQRAHRGGRVALWHDGGTGGFRSMLVVEPSRARAAVALVNSTQSPEALAIKLLDAAVTVPPLPARPGTVAVDPAVLARYPGRYRLAPTFAMVITPRDTRGLHLQVTGQQRFRLYPRSPTEFFLTEVPASVTFEADSAGRIAALVLHQNGIAQRAPRDP